MKNISIQQAANGFTVNVWGGTRALGEAETTSDYFAETFVFTNAKEASEFIAAQLIDVNETA